MKLRKLTEKSQFKFGKYADCTVQNIIDHDLYYIRWAYYHCSHIDFFGNILDIAGIPNDFRLNKPDKNETLYNKLIKDKKFIEMRNEQSLKLLKKDNDEKISDLNEKLFRKQVRRHNKGLLQKLNHGK